MERPFQPIDLVWACVGFATVGAFALVVVTLLLATWKLVGWAWS